MKKHTMSTLKAFAKTFNAEHNFTKIVGVRKGGASGNFWFNVKTLNQDDKRKATYFAEHNVNQGESLETVAKGICSDYVGYTDFLRNRPDVRAFLLANPVKA